MGVGMDVGLATDHAEKASVEGIDCAERGRGRHPRNSAKEGG